jgi:hypothetical protein
MIGGGLLSRCSLRQVPTSRADSESQYEGGVIIPLSIQFSKDWKLGMQLALDRLGNEKDMGYHSELLHALALSHPWSKN